MMEVMNDPELKPLLSGMPMGMPQGMAVPVPTGQPAASSTAVEDGGGEMTFDPTVISGPAKTSRTAVKKVPPPVDNGQ